MKPGKGNILSGGRVYLDNIEKDDILFECERGECIVFQVNDNPVFNDTGCYFTGKRLNGTTINFFQAKNCGAYGIRLYEYPEYSKIVG